MRKYNFAKNSPAAFYKVFQATGDPQKVFLNYIDLYNDSPAQIEIEKIPELINKYKEVTAEFVGVWIENGAEFVTEYYIVSKNLFIHKTI